jgi:hypothetical protein
VTGFQGKGCSNERPVTRLSQGALSFFTWCHDAAMLRGRRAGASCTTPCIRTRKACHAKAVKPKTHEHVLKAIQAYKSKMKTEQ